MTVYTIGHSNLDPREFRKRLEAWSVTHLIDVRRFPGSRRHPGFNREALAATLAEHGIGYSHFVSLGGRREPRSDSCNLAWKNAGFRGYADYMETDAFREGILELLSIAESGQVAIMCAEAVWWRCHRSLIADHLKVRGHTVYHLLSATRSEPHPYTSAARILQGQLTYRPDASDQDLGL